MIVSLSSSFFLSLFHSLFERTMSEVPKVSHIERDKIYPIFYVGLRKKIWNSLDYATGYQKKTIPFLHYLPNYLDCVISPKTMLRLEHIIKVIYQ